MPLPSTQFPMYEQESPIFSGQGPATSPLEIPMVEGWQLLESPDFMFEETAEMVMQPAAECSPEFMHEESPEFDLNHLLRVRLGRVMYRRQYHQLYKANGILDNLGILRCHVSPRLWWSVDVVATVRNITHTIVSK